MGKIDDRVIDPEPRNPAITPSNPNPRNDQMEKLFRDIAGNDMEVDWMELKKILDHTMRDDFGMEHASSSSNQQAAIGNGDDGGGGQTTGGILALICAGFCKDNQIADNLGLTQPLTRETETTVTSQIYKDTQGFSKDICRSMVAMLDVDASGKLGFEEFQTLLTDIAKWKAVFKLYDHDKSGRLSSFELREALHSAGYTLNNKILNALAHRYSSRDGMITFDDFIMCAVKIKTMIDIFKDHDIDGNNSATFNMEDWLQKTVYS